MPESTELQDKLKTLQAMFYLGLALLFVLVLFLVGLVSVQAYQRGKDAERVKQAAQQTHDSLCAFKVDLETRHEELQALLRKNPGPFPAASLGLPDVPRDVLENSLANQEQTLDTLVLLDCS